MEIYSGQKGPCVLINAVISLGGFGTVSSVAASLAARPLPPSSARERVAGAWLTRAWLGATRPKSCPARWDPRWDKTPHCRTASAIKGGCVCSSWLHPQSQQCFLPVGRRWKGRGRRWVSFSCGFPSRSQRPSPCSPPRRAHFGVLSLQPQGQAGQRHTEQWVWHWGCAKNAPSLLLGCFLLS